MENTENTEHFQVEKKFIDVPITLSNGENVILKMTEKQYEHLAYIAPEYMSKMLEEYYHHYKFSNNY